MAAPLEPAHRGCSLPRPAAEQGGQVPSGPPTHSAPSLVPWPLPSCPILYFAGRTEASKQHSSPQGLWLGCWAGQEAFGASWLLGGQGVPSSICCLATISRETVAGLQGCGPAAPVPLWLSFWSQGGPAGGQTGLSAGQGGRRETRLLHRVHSRSPSCAVGRGTVLLNESARLGSRGRGSK